MENHKEYLTEENYQKSNNKVKKIGNILIITGIALAVLGFIILIASFFGIGSQINNGMEFGQEGINPGGIFASFGGFAIGGLIIAPSSILIFIGIFVRFLLGNRREISAYATQQIMPLTKEKIDKMTPTISGAVGKISKEVAKGIKEVINENDKNQ